MRLIKASGALATLAILAGLVSCGGSQAAPATLTVLGPWTGTAIGTEGWDFEQVLADFTKETGIQVNYVGARSLTQVLQAEVQAGDPPDLADLPSPEAVASYADQGEIHQLDNILTSKEMAPYSRQWRQLEMVGTDHIYAVVVKADLKSIIWYDPQHLPSRPGTWTWSQLIDHTKKWAQSGTTPWCLGVASTSTSGWPGTDWIADILLHQSGEKAYQKWTDGILPWNSPQVTSAWTTWGKIIAPGQVYGGSISALLTSFSSAGAPMFDKTPGCYLDHEASFIMPDYEQDGPPRGPQPQPGTNFKFFQFPEIGSSGSTALQVSGDFMAMFRNSQAARELITYLAGKGQSVWPSIPGGGAFSVDKDVSSKVYKTQSGKPDPVSGSVAELLASPSNTLCFDAADLMPQAMQNAFYLAILEYLQIPNPSQLQLTSILNQLDKVRTTAYPTPLNFQCGSS